MPAHTLVPRSVLFGNPERVAPKISPDGTRLAWIAPHEGVLNVWVRELDGGEPRVVTGDAERGVRTFVWAPDDAGILYLQDTGGDENWRVHLTDLASGVTRDLTPFPQVQAQLLGIDMDVPDRILVGLNREDPQLHDVYVVDLASGSVQQVLDNPGFIGMTQDSELVVRAGLAPEPDGGMRLMVRSAEGAAWRELLYIPREDALTSQPITFSGDGQRLLMTLSVGANTSRLVWVDVESGEVEVVAADPDYDVTDVWLQRRTRTPLMVAFQKERVHWQVLDTSVAEDLAALRELDSGDLLMLGRDRADQVWIVAFDHADGPGRFYAYHRGSRTADFLFASRPELDGYQLAPMEPFSFTARDGLTVHGYLTFPPGTDPKSGPRLPAVLDVHGGPWTRDQWGFDAEAQWFANRGYVCVQVNYRGSTGYGKQFVNAGDREWGAGMHDDLVDAVAWIIDAGYADPDRVGIYGGSYGGYAALVGAAFTPDLFRCAVDIVGPSNLSTLIGSIPPYWVPMIAQFHERVGNPETEPDFLWERSPLSRAGDIRIP
ncbi:MAG: prolyl oligopeptidase family serine peptidase, partial [Kineosporiaceae bacterium]